MPCLCAVLDVFLCAIGGIFGIRCNVRNRFRHCQAQLDDRFKVQRHLLVHPVHIGDAYILNRAFTHSVNGDSKKGKHEGRETNGYRDTDFQRTWQSLVLHIDFHLHSVS